MPKAKEFFPEIIRVKVEDLIPYARNQKEHPEEQIAEIMGSITEYKFVSPIEIADNVIVAGHGRLEAAKRLKLSEVPCIDVSHMSPGQIKAYRITSNRLAEKAPWINELLAVELQELAELPDVNLETTGYSKEDIANLILWAEGEFGDGEDGDQDDESEPPPSEDFSVFEVALTHKNKLHLMDTIRRVKADNETNSTESALMILCDLYAE